MPEKRYDWTCDPSGSGYPHSVTGVIIEDRKRNVAYLREDYTPEDALEVCAWLNGNDIPLGWRL